MFREKMGSFASTFARTAFSLAEAGAEKVIEPIDRLSYSQAEKEMVATLRKAEEEERRSIGNSFRENLLPGLPRELADFSKVFSIPADHTLKRAKRQSIDVLSAGYDGYLLSEYGLSPRDILRASNSIEAMMRFRIREFKLNPEEPFVYSEGSRDTTNTNIVSKRDIVREVWHSTEIPFRTTLQLSDWILKVLPHRPNMLGRFQYEKDGNQARFVPKPNQERNIKVRWSAPKE